MVRLATRGTKLHNVCQSSDMDEANRIVNNWNRKGKLEIGRNCGRTGYGREKSRIAESEMGDRRELRNTAARVWGWGENTREV
jgi:hypothetical protein